jgi:uncharacterized protein DUF4939
MTVLRSAIPASATPPQSPSPVIPAVAISATQDELSEVELLRAEISRLRGLSYTTIKEPKVKLPNPFDGSQRDLRGFVNHILLVFRLQPETYKHDHTKVLTVVTLLTKLAMEWANPLVESDDPILHNFDGFLKKFITRFEDPTLQKTAKARIRALRQGKAESAAVFATKFQAIAADTGYGDEALRDFFRDGLPIETQKMLLSLPEETSIDELIANTIRCDSRLKQFNLRTTPTQAPQTSLPDNIIAAIRPSTTTPAGVGPRASLTDEEKERRFAAGLCLYCGGDGHLANTCPLLARRKALAGNAPARG